VLEELEAAAAAATADAAACKVHKPDTAGKAGPCRQLHSADAPDPYRRVPLQPRSPLPTLKRLARGGDWQTGGAATSRRLALDHSTGSQEAPSPHVTRASARQRAPAKAGSTAPGGSESSLAPLRPAVHHSPGSQAAQPPRVTCSSARQRSPANTHMSAPSGKPSDMPLDSPPLREAPPEVSVPPPEACGSGGTHQPGRILSSVGVRPDADQQQAGLGKRKAPPLSKSSEIYCRYE